MFHVKTARYLNQTELLMVEPSVEGQSPSVLHHHGLGVPPPPAAEQIQGGQGLDGGHAAATSTEAMTETL